MENQPEEPVGTEQEPTTDLASEAVSEFSRHSNNSRSADNQLDADTATNEEVQAGEEKDVSEETFLKSLNPEELSDELKDFYKSMQGDYTRSKQQIAEERRAIQEELEAGREATLLLQRILDSSEDPDAESEYEEYTEDGEIDQIALLQHRIDELESARQAELQQREEYEQQRYYQNVVDHIDQRLDELAKLRRHDLSDEDRDLIYSYITFAGPDDQGNPQVEQAYHMLTKSWENRQQAWLRSKEAQSTDIGPQGSPIVNIDDYDDLSELAYAQYKASVESKNNSL